MMRFALLTFLAAVTAAQEEEMPEPNYKPKDGTGLGTEKSPLTVILLDTYEDVDTFDPPDMNSNANGRMWVDFYSKANKDDEVELHADIYLEKLMDTIDKDRIEFGIAISAAESGEVADVVYAKYQQGAFWYHSNDDREFLVGEDLGGTRMADVSMLARNWRQDFEVWDGYVDSLSDDITSSDRDDTGPANWEDDLQLNFKNFDDSFFNTFKVHVVRKFDTGDSQDIPLAVDQANKLFIRGYHIYDPYDLDEDEETVTTKAREVTIEYTKPAPPETEEIVNDSAINSVVFSSVLAGLTLAYLN